MGEKRALLTVDPGNLPSIKVIEANGGRFENTVADPETGKEFNRYWIELQSPVPGYGCQSDRRA